MLHPKQPAVNYEYLPDPNVEAVRSKLLDRSKTGFSKYGTDTTRSDLDAAAWLRHLQEELMDGCVYIERLLKEQVFLELLQSVREGGTILRKMETP